MGAKAFLEAAALIDAVPFGIITDADLAKANEVSNSVVLFKNFDDKKSVLSASDLTPDAVLDFVKGNKMPLLVYFTQDVCS